MFLLSHTLAYEHLIKTFLTMNVNAPNNIMEGFNSTQNNINQQTITSTSKNTSLIL